MALRLAFMGTPDFSVSTLQALYDAGHEVVAVYSQPPRKAGRRGLEVTPSPVHQLAETLNIPVYTPTSLKSAQEQENFAALKLDCAVVVAYGMLLPTAILDAPRLGCYNGHASLLPRWRGAAPIQRAIMAGDSETGMMVMKMDAGLDTGDTALCQKIAIGANTTSGELHDALSKIGATLMVAAMEKLEAGTLTLTPQPQDGITYATKISKEEARIDWSKPADVIQKQICGLAPFPGAWCEMALSGHLGNTGTAPQSTAYAAKMIGHTADVDAISENTAQADTASKNTAKADVMDRIKILGATLVDGPSNGTAKIEANHLIIHCGTGKLQITRLQKSGGKALDADIFLRGFHVSAVC